MLCGRFSEWVDEEDIGSSSDERRSLPGTDALENIRRLRTTGVEDLSVTGDWSVGTRLLIVVSRTIGKVVCGGVEDTSTKGSMRVSVVGS